MKLLLILKRNIPTSAEGYYVSNFHTTDCVAEHNCVQIVGASLPQVEETVELLCICRM
jgi:hypothetical protein